MRHLTIMLAFALLCACDDPGGGGGPQPFVPPSGEAIGRQFCVQANVQTCALASPPCDSTSQYASVNACMAEVESDGYDGDAPAVATADFGPCLRALDLGCPLEVVPF